MNSPVGWLFLFREVHRLQGSSSSPADTAYGFTICSSVSILTFVRFVISSIVASMLASWSFTIWMAVVSIELSAISSFTAVAIANPARRRKPPGRP